MKELENWLETKLADSHSLMLMVHWSPLDWPAKQGDFFSIKPSRRNVKTNAAIYSEEDETLFPLIVTPESEKDKVEREKVKHTYACTTKCAFLMM